MRLLLSAVLIASSTAFAAEIPVTVSDIVTGASSHVRITNTSRQPVTAWSLAATTEKPGGGTHREVYTTDGYLSEATHGLPKAAERLERLMPGESRELPLDPLPAGAKVEVIAAVLDDGTAMGEEKALAAIFANRVKERDALKAVVDVFNAVLPEKRGAEALSALRDRFSRAGSTERHRALPRRARRGAGLRAKGPGARDRHVAAHLRRLRQPRIPARGEALTASIRSLGFSEERSSQALSVSSFGSLRAESYQLPHPTCLPASCSSSHFDSGAK